MIVLVAEHGLVSGERIHPSEEGWRDRSTLMNYLE
jgi:hypothetical protein